MCKNPNLRILMSVEDFDQYDDELTQLANKGTAPTDINQERYKGIPFEVLTQWPQGLIVATLCDSGMNGNLSQLSTCRMTKTSFRLTSGECQRTLLLQDADEGGHADRLR